MRRAWRSFLAVRFDRLSSYRNYRWGDSRLVTFWPKHGLRSDLRVPNFKYFPGGACPQIPLACSHLSARNGRTSLKYLAPALQFMKKQDIQTFSILLVPHGSVSSTFLTVNANFVS